MKITLIGGGNGVSEIAKLFIDKLAIVPENINLVLPVTDSGRSTGIARELFNMPAPGDIRNSILKFGNHTISSELEERILAQSEKFSLYNGMSIGNLLLGTLYKKHGSLQTATDRLCDVVSCRVNIYPVSEACTHICAKTEEGTEYVTELNVRTESKPKIVHLYLQDPCAEINPLVTKAIKTSDVIIIGPGCLYTSIIAILVFNEMAEALRASHAKKVYICNSTTQPGQTDGYSCVNHLEEIVKYTGIQNFDYSIFNSTINLDQEVINDYANEGLQLITPQNEEFAKISKLVANPIYSELLEDIKEKREIWNKKDTIRYDHTKLAKIFKNILT